MKKTIFAVASVLALSTAVAFAQPSQAQGGGQTGPNSNSATSSGSMNNGSMNNGAGSGMSNSTTGMSNSGMAGNMAKDKDGMAKNPSSQGNVGPGTTPGNPGSK